MKRLIFAAAILTLTANTDRAQAQINDQGPGAGGAVLKDPFAPTVPSHQTAPDAPASSLDLLLKKNPSGPAPAQSKVAEKLAEYAASKDNAFNDEIKIKPGDGPCAIFIQCYVGDDCHQLARRMVEELRTAYKLRAYTFNKGAKEKHEEYARVMDSIAKKREAYVKMGGSPDVPIRVGIITIQEQCAVILGGYASLEAAKSDLDNRIRKLKPLDPDKVMLDKRVVYEEEKQKDSYKSKKQNEVYINPFLAAFVGHNPTIEQKRPAEWDQLDMGLLQKLNAGEPYSLLECKKKFTLAVKNFPTPTIVQTKNAAGGFLDNIMGGKAGQPKEDGSAKAAHSLTMLLRKLKIEAYVLHTKYTSIVCVGGFDSKDDPRMRTLAEMMETQIMPQINQHLPALPNPTSAPTQMMPMEIPH